MYTSYDAINVMREYVVGSTDVEAFSARYVLMWKALRDSGQMAREPHHVQRGLDVIFTALDSFETDVGNGQELKQRESILSAEVRAVLSVLHS
jgi:hypothetical protein